MKRRFTILAAAFALLAFLAIPMGMWGQVTWTASEQGYENAQDVTSFTVDDQISGVFAKADGTNAPKYYTSGNAVRMYSGNTLTITPEASYQITRIEFGFSQSGGFTVSTGSYTNGVWTGTAASDVVFTNGASQNRIQTITVSYSEAGGTTYTVTYNANVTGVAPVVDTYAEGADVTLRPANTFSNEGFSFSKWNTQANGEGDPYDAGDVVNNIQANLELYAIWIENETPGGEEQWVLTNLSDLTASDVFVIVSTKGDANYAMSNDKGASAAPTAVAVTVSNSTLTGTIAENIQWTGITGDGTNGYIIYSNVDNAKYLYCTNNNNGLRVGSGDDNTFIIKDNYIYNVGQGRYIGVYNNADWRCYTTINNNITGQTFAFYKKVTGGVTPPSITANNIVEIAYNATSGSFDFTVNNPVEGGVTTIAEEVEWISNATITENTVNFTTTANEAGTAREGVITLTYTYNREAVTKNVTVTQAGNPDATMTIAEVRTQGSGDVVTIGTVTSCVGTTGYIQDATAAICVYGTSLTVGDEIRVSGTLSTYHGLLEITNPEVTVISQGNTIDPEVMTIADINASTNQGWYIRIENATVTEINDQNTTIAQGENTIVVRGISGVEYAVNDIISLDGNIGCYNVAQIANPQNVEVQQSTELSITVTPTTVSVPAAGGNGTITVTYTNFVDIEPSVEFFAADGETQASYDWIAISFDSNNNALYTVDANDGEARSAYFKVYEQSEGLYSDLITINQAEYVAPALDYAELPFEFNGGRAEIEGTDGLTQEGLGTDYTTNNTKLKFDNEGDWLLLHFNEEPGTLTFDIKGNSFSGGTFTVQTSEDGVTYTDLAAYTALGNTDTKTFNNLDENVRYIKWIYTTKSSGNVGLGNIALAKPAHAITIDPDLIEVGAEGGEGGFEYIPNWIDGGWAEGFEFYDAPNGETIDQPEWITIVYQMGENEDYHYTIAANDGEARSAYFKFWTYDDDDVTVVYSNLVTINQAAYEVPFTGATYTLATTIESGKTYIIVGNHTVDDVTSYYAMGEQKNNNRAGVAISVDGTTAIVGSPDVHEVVITALEEQGFYSIYDGGYLYAASKTANQLKTEDELDVNGQWKISIDDDGQFSIVASHSENRNVMQFNYNGGNPLFSCYASASQLPVYLYEKVADLPANSLVINGYGNSDGGYYLIASPFKVKPTDVPGMTEGEYDLYAFDQAEEDEWRNYEAGEFTYLEPGTGYLYAHQTTVILTFDGEPYTGNGTITLAKTDGGDFPGWNLVGNPFGETAYIDRDFYVMQEDGAEIIAGEGNEIAAMQGIFVVAAEDGEEMTFSTEASTTNGEKLVMNLSNARSSVIDRAMVRFGEGRTLPKFMLNENNTKLYIAEGEEEYAVVRSIDENTTPVSFRAAENGTYTLSVNAENVEMEYLHLIDNMTGADIDLLATPSYTFEARTTDYANRFNLVYATYDDVNENNNQPFAFFNGSEWVISNDGEATLQVIDVNGRMLSNETVNGNANISINQTSGVYMIRLINGDSVMVQKVVVK